MTQVGAKRRAHVLAFRVPLVQFEQEELRWGGGEGGDKRKGGQVAGWSRCV